jgi:hypothetical protein
MDPLHDREGEDELFRIIHSPRDEAEERGAEDCGADDGSQFLNDSGPGMEIEMHTSADNDTSGTAGPPEVYMYMTTPQEC